MIKLKQLLVENDMGMTPSLIKKLAHAKGYTIQTYRGDTDSGHIYSYTRKERREYGVFTTPLREVAAIYAGDRYKGEPRLFYVKAPKVLDLTKDSLDNMRWVQKWGESFDEWIDRETGEEVDAWHVLEGGRMFDYEGDWSSERWMDIQATAHHEGYDAIVLPDFDSKHGIFPSLVVFDEKNLKLADVATYDDKEQLISPEQRFDSSSSDIRY